MDRPDAVVAARDLVSRRFPDAGAAWLAGSVASGTATSTSDLDVTVLLDAPGAADGPAPFRESLVHDDWPVELFVHTPASVERWLARDHERRRPTLARLVAGGIPLLDVTGGGARAVARCEDFLRRGPAPLSEDERGARRYRLTDQLDDLADLTGPADGQLRTAVAVELWRQGAELLLLEGGCWLGTGKWLVREVEGYDATHGTRFGARLADGLLAALHGEPGLLAETVDEVLAGSGGRLWAGYRMGG